MHYWPRVRTNWIFLRFFNEIRIFRLSLYIYSIKNLQRKKILYSYRKPSLEYFFKIFVFKYQVFKTPNQMEEKYFIYLSKYFLNHIQCVFLIFIFIDFQFQFFFFFCHPLHSFHSSGMNCSIYIYSAQKRGKLDTLRPSVRGKYKQPKYMHWKCHHDLMSTTTASTTFHFHLKNDKRDSGVEFNGFLSNHISL